MKKIFLIGLSLFLVFNLNSVSAEELKIGGNGQESVNTIVIDSGSTLNINQSNGAFINNEIKAKSNTGGNSITAGEGGKIITGNAKTTVKVNNILNQNIITSPVPSKEIVPTSTPKVIEPTSSPSVSGNSNPVGGADVSTSPQSAPKILGLSNTSSTSDFLEFLFSVSFPDISSISDNPSKINYQSLGINLDVVPARIVNGYWQTPQTNVGFGIGTSLPKDNGNTVIFAHAKDSLFGPLKKSKIGDKITIYTQEKSFTYQVKEIKIVEPTDTSVVLPSSDSRLTLFTCTGPADSQRLVVVATRTAGL